MTRERAPLVPPGHGSREGTVQSTRQPAGEKRVAVFSGRYAGASAVEAVEAMAREHAGWRFLVLQEFPPRDPRRLARAKLRRLRAEPLGYPRAFLRARLDQRRAPRPGADRPALPDGLAALRLPNVTYHRCERLHDDASLELVRAWDPWLGIALAAPILRAGLFTIPSIGTINLHMSLLPEYRGMPPGFWELHDGARRTGVTVHWIDEGLDTGDIICQDEVEIPRFATPAGLQALLDATSIRTLGRAVRQLAEGTATARPQGPAATPTRSRPPFRLLRTVERRCRALGRHREGLVRGTLKRLALLAFCYGWVPIRNGVRRVRGTARTSLLLYHRVSDDHRDRVTVGVEQFWHQLVMLRRHYEVVDPATWLRTQGRPAHRPRVVITFDDGYRDNLVAAALLRRAGMGAVFFVSTGLMGTDRGFPHDLEELGRAVPTLDWDDIRRMARDGFLIGNHTVDHVNLGRVDPSEGIRQVAQAAAELERQLDDPPASRWLAYPYGGPSDMSDELRTRLPEHGIEYCFSAYGGANPPDFERWNIRRQGVDHSMSMLRLRAAIEGWRA